MARKEDLSAGTTGMSHAAKRLLAIVAYYIVFGIVLAVAWRFWPALRQLFAGTTLADLVAGPGITLSRSDVADSLRSSGSVSALQQGTSTLLVLAGVLATALPLAWTYSLTRRRRGFEQSMVHILVLLPLAVAGMVVLIQNSLPLAFSLAGIVAVLRFRNALDDVKDGVYIFICVSIGMSAAVGALTIGLLTSIIFNASVLVLWWLDFARRPTPGIRGGVWKLMRLPKVSPPKAPNVLRPADGRDGGEAFASAARAWRRQLQLTSEYRAASPKGHVNASLQVFTTAPDETRPLVERVLDARTHRWKFVGIMPATDGLTTLKYRVRVRRSARTELLDEVRAVARAVGAELV
jgi:hypothetical protein